MTYRTVFPIITTVQVPIATCRVVSQGSERFYLADPAKGQVPTSKTLVAMSRPLMLGVTETNHQSVTTSIYEPRSLGTLVVDGAAEP